MFGPHNSMVGDTVMVYVGYVDSIYDVEYTQSGGDVERVAEGIITVSPEATK